MAKKKVTQGRRITVVALCVAVALSLMWSSNTLRVKAANGLPDDLKIVWDMEAIPEDLFAGGMALSQEDSTGGHSYGYTDALKAPGKGVDGSAAVALRYNENCPGSQFWSSGWHLALYKDATANADWYGVREIWFYIDISEFSTSNMFLDFMVDGVKPEIGGKCWIVRNGNRTEKTFESAYGGATNGRIQLPTGFKGWVGASADAFKTTFGKIKTVSFAIEPSSDLSRLPLAMYVDQIGIVRDNTDSALLRVGGDKFNEGTDRGESVLSIDTTKHYQLINDYGASSAWWAPYMGKSPFVDEALKMIFTDDGAGLNSYRHNVGSAVKADLSDRGTTTGGRSPFSPLTEEGTYDETRDSESLAVLEKLKKLGTIDMWVMFMNSPPSTMTNNGMTNGDAWGESLSNLRKDCYENYVNYVVDMVQLYNYLGYPFDYVSPINEPQYDWTGTGQEGCHYSPDETLEIDTMVVEELNRRRKKDPTIITKISGSESGSWNDKSYVNYYFLRLLSNDTLRNNSDHFAAHSYGTNADAKRRMVSELQGIGISLAMKQTEYGPGFAYPDFTIKTALDVARVMYEDLSIINVDSWAYWRAVANGNYTDGLAYANRGGNLVIPSKRLWAMGQYARFTKGATRVAADESKMPKKTYSTAYVNPDDNQIVVVVVNEGKDNQVFSFEGIKAGTIGQVFETSALRDLENRGTMTVDSGYILPAESITTFVFNGQDIDSSSFERKEKKDPNEGQSQEDPSVTPSSVAPEQESSSEPAIVPSESEKETEKVPEESSSMNPPSESVPASTENGQEQNADSNNRIFRTIGIALGAALIVGSIAGLVLSAKRRKETM